MEGEEEEGRKERNCTLARMGSVLLMNILDKLGPNLVTVTNYIGTKSGRSNHLRQVVYL